MARNAYSSEYNKLHNVAVITQESFNKQGELFINKQAITDVMKAIKMEGNNATLKKYDSNATLDIVEKMQKNSKNIGAFIAGEYVENNAFIELINTDCKAILLTGLGGATDKNTIINLTNILKIDIDNPYKLASTLQKEGLMEYGKYPEQVVDNILGREPLEQQQQAEQEVAATQPIKDNSPVLS